MFLKDVLLYYILWFYEVFFSWLLFWWLFEVFAQPFVLDGQGPYLSSLLLLLEPVHLRHYSGRINTSELVCHPLVGFIWGKPQSWALVHDEWAACHQWSFEREMSVFVCWTSIGMGGNSPSSFCRRLCFLIKGAAELSREMNPVTGLLAKACLCFLVHCPHFIAAWTLSSLQPLLCPAVCTSNGTHLLSQNQSP